MCWDFTVTAVQSQTLFSFPLRNISNALGTQGVSVLGQQMWQELGLVPLWHRNSSGAKAAVVKSEPT